MDWSSLCRRTTSRKLMFGNFVVRCWWTLKLTWATSTITCRLDSRKTVSSLCAWVWLMMQSLSLRTNQDHGNQTEGTERVKVLWIGFTSIRVLAPSSSRKQFTPWRKKSFKVCWSTLLSYSTRGRTVHTRKSSIFLHGNDVAELPALAHRVPLLSSSASLFLVSAVKAGAWKKLWCAVCNSWCTLLRFSIIM